MTILWLPRVKPWLKFVLQKNCFPHIIDSTLRLIFSRSPQPVNKLLVWWTRLKKRIQHVLWYYFVGTPGNYLIPDVVSRSSYILISISIWSCHLPHSPLPTPSMKNNNRDHECWMEDVSKDAVSFVYNCIFRNIFHPALMVTVIFILVCRNSWSLHLV